MIEAFVIDIDGTFIDSKGNIPQENLDALKEIEEEGIMIFFASGRMLSSVIKFQSSKLNKIHPIIAYNGAVVWNGRDVIFSKNITTEMAKDIVSYSLSKGLYIQAYVNDELVVPFDCEKAREYAKHSAVDFRVEEKFIEFVTKNTPTKLLIIDTPEKVEVLSAHFAARYNHLNVFRSFATYLDLLPEGVNKGLGLKYLCEDLHVDPACVVAFGDNDNDVPLFEEAGFSVAVANATPNARKAADVIASANYEAGFGRTAMKLIKLLK
ncbi:hypothetical protein AT15_07055 [Kosmotoga arenicorallina S304]|uniref:HAD family hydrolase n=1 Tax=Kosmotoga arenicorallina S304 TaxID=1453497 RepID=A0A176K2F5_9BACT|nr:Cof-type HAD-IIB family hydrolase [Kosmotoga arenicorallina]OAA31248.1 hypothetical protein AT15_07055 [Kosmotoga arenicorallina S304]